jgi:predicted solute-binding protein
MAFAVLNSNKAGIGSFFSKFSNRSKPSKSFNVSACPHAGLQLPVYFGFRERTPNVAKLRISIVQYLNTAPLVWGFTNGPLRGKYDLSFTLPSLCAEALRSGAADIAIIPAIEYQRMDNLMILPDMAIASKNRVRSLLIISKMPIEDARNIALDSSSRSTQALTRILCDRSWKIAPEFIEMPPDINEMLRRADAALLIGDPALRLSITAEPDAKRGPSGELVCSAASAGVSHAGSLHVYDVVEEQSGRHGPKLRTQTLSRIFRLHGIWGSKIWTRSASKPPGSSSSRPNNYNATSRRISISISTKIICAASQPISRLPPQLGLYPE